LGRFLDVCNAVAYAHSRGVLHRDLKPGNVMLGKFGETLLVDWGLTKIVGRPVASAEATAASATGDPTLRPVSGSGVAETAAAPLAGPPRYRSPELAEGKVDQLGPATDIYSLGATLYCLLTGRPPVAQGKVAEVLERVRRGDIPPPNQVRSGVPKALAAICLK